MPPHALGSGTISFGLVSIPIKLYTAAGSANVSFNLLHAKCGSRIRQQTFCPTCNETVERSALVRGYEFAKDQYVRVTDDELKALEGEASKVIDIAEFVPLAKVDPIYFEKTYYLGADKGGEKPYRLLADAMEKSGQVALATFVMRGKDGTLRGFYNVCAHRAHELLKGCGQTKVITCPYHAWSYHSDGRLRTARGSEKVAGFQADEFCLKQVKVDELCGFVFVEGKSLLQQLLRVASTAIVHAFNLIGLQVGLLLGIDLDAGAVVSRAAHAQLSQFCPCDGNSQSLDHRFS